MGDHFRSLWGKEAGWAHSVLFAADLRAFSKRLTTNAEVTDAKKEEGLETTHVFHVKTEVDLDSSLKRKFLDDKTVVKAEAVPSPKRPKRRRGR